MQPSVHHSRAYVLTTGLLNKNNEWMVCDWQALCAQLLLQWNRLTSDELKAAGANRRRIASLVSKKYDIDSHLVENYLSNLERTLPLV